MPKKSSQEVLGQALYDIYNKLSVQFMKPDNEGSDGKNQTKLTAVERKSMETIMALDSQKDHPTVSDFKDALQISAPNAAYRVAKLKEKGYLKKSQGKRDGRKFFLEPTDKYKKYISDNELYLDKLSERIRESFSDEDYDKLVEMLTKINDELMPKAEMISKGGNTDATD